MGDASTSFAPELLAPAGNWECVKAAIENGADAVYFGLATGFNARARAANFAVDELPSLMTLLRRRGVKGYVTLNTLVFPEELESFEIIVRRVAEGGADAVLVQDLGAAQLIRSICPELPIHASTQMTLTSAESIRLAESLGVERVVLARELSIKEVRMIRRQTSMPLEVFVHGALCVAYSGQCLTSESLGGRSANRGQCAQACRLPYELVCDGNDVDLADQKYLLSPQDLAAYALVPDLIEAGVCCLKIEGRLKTPEYVANITRHYRQAIDSAMAGKPVAFTPLQIEEMELSFSRGFSPGWLLGCDHKQLVPATSSAKRGVLLGEVVSAQNERVKVRLDRSVRRGDGVVFEGGRWENEEQGGRVFEVFVKGRSTKQTITDGVVELTFAHGAVDIDRLHVGQKVWKTDDPKLTRRLRKTFTSRNPLRRTPLDITIHAAVGEPLRLIAIAAIGAQCELVTEAPLEQAIKHPLTEALLEQQLGRLGGTPYELRYVTAQITGAPMVPLSVLGKLRREMVRRLENDVPPPRSISTESVLPILRSAEVAQSNENACALEEPTLHVLCRSLAQMPPVIEQGVKNIYVDFQDIRKYGEAVSLARAHDVEIFLATPRIQKPEEIGVFRAMLKQGANGVLVRNLGALSFFAEAGAHVIADFSLNAANELTANLLRQWGVQRVTISYDLNREQALSLAAACPPSWLEIVIHQHMPMFHMEHCVFCAVLSPGTNKTNCGRPCDDHHVHLRDQMGKEHPLTADIGCRNTLFNATPQSGAEIVPQLLSHGLRHFRVELLDDAPQNIRNTIALYQDLLAQRVTGQDVWKTLKAINRVGITRGTLEEG